MLKLLADLLQTDSLKSWGKNWLQLGMCFDSLKEDERLIIRILLDSDTPNMAIVKLNDILYNYKCEYSMDLIKLLLVLQRGVFIKPVLNVEKSIVVETSHSRSPMVRPNLRQPLIITNDQLSYYTEDLIIYDSATLPWKKYNGLELTISELKRVIAGYVIFIMFINVKSGRIR